VDPSQPKGSYWLVGVGGNTRRVRLSADGPLLVGRGAHNHLVLNDYRISRQHSRVANERDGFVVYDLNSANGTSVNGVAVRRQPIKPGDEVRFGPHAFRVEFHHDSTAAGPIPSSPVKWRATESITKFHQLNQISPNALAPPRVPSTGPASTTGEEVVAFRETLRESTHDTIPPEGVGSIEEITDYHDPGFGEPPASRESAKFRAEIATVDLNHLEDAYQKVGTLYAFMQAISKTIHKRELLELIAGKVLEIYPAARSVGIYLRAARGKNAGDDEAPFHLVHLAGDEDAKQEPVLRDATRRAVLWARQAIFSAGAQQAASAGWTMYAPMLDHDEVLGVISVSAGESRREFFTAGDLELLNGIAVSAAIMMQNTRMHEESLQRERLNRDLELAAQIQKSFLPREVLSVPGVEFLATYKAAYTVGGDFYDVFWVGPTQLAVFVGDIAGKGVAAALLMARISGELRVAALAHIDPVAVFTIMNKAMINRNQPELFFTATYFTLDVKTGEVWLATAGQPSPYLCHADGTIEAITEGASGAVGMLDDPQFTSTHLFLEDGDSLVLYTDGVVEAAALDGSLYGDERLAECLAYAGSRPADISEQLLRSVAQHTLTAPANDDLTVFICHRVDGGPASLQPRRFGSIQEAPKTDRDFTARR
jgi:serine phosphatase RsbU (regulator of sigma subunit)/pSer/pThr/pTyr-binding forkhead associated (FHA) protein